MQGVKEMKQLVVTELNSPIGILTLMASMTGICHMSFGQFSEIELELNQWAADKLGARSSDIKRIAAKDHPMLNKAAEELGRYFDGSLREFDLPLDMMGTPFQLKVWEALRQIPYGETRSYKDIACMIGQPNAMRAVGGANNRNPVSIIVPCHRVIGANGQLVGYGGGLPIKTMLLSLEKTS